MKSEKTKWLAGWTNYVVRRIQELPNDNLTEIEDVTFEEVMNMIKELNGELYRKIL